MYDDFNGFSSIGILIIILDENVIFGFGYNVYKFLILTDEDAILAEEFVETRYFMELGSIDKHYHLVHHTVQPHFF